MTNANYANVWYAIQAFQNEHNGRSPSVAELIKACGKKSNSYATASLHRLEKTGCLRYKVVSKKMVIALIHAPNQPLPPPHPAVKRKHVKIVTPQTPKKKYTAEDMEERIKQIQNGVKFKYSNEKGWQK